MFSSRIRALVQRQWAGLIALFLVLTGGTAWAVDGPLPGQNQVGSLDVINNDLRAPDIGEGGVQRSEIADGEVRSAEVLNNSLTGSDINESTLDVGDAARAYARVDPEACTGGVPGTCTAEQSKGVSSVTHDFTGVYCVTAPGIDSGVTPAAVTVDSNSTPDPAGNASAMTDEGFGCGASGEGFSVFTERQPENLVNSGGGINNANVSGVASESNTVGFTIVIP